MALLQKIDLPTGLSVANAYHRIDMIVGNKKLLSIQINSYVSQADYNNAKFALESKEYSFIPNIADDAPNFIRQGYEYLKTLPEFTDAIDA